MSKEMITEKLYINIERMTDELFGILKDARDSLTYENDGEHEFIMEQYSDDLLNERLQIWLMNLIETWANISMPPIIKYMEISIT